MPGRTNILLSTYNGMQFLDQQIESLLSQSYPDIAITVRDDGSTDGTCERLLEYSSRRSNFKVTRGDRMGVVGSYLTLLREADPACEFYAFCDQDDVWLPDKIRVAVTAMESHSSSQPLMYFSRLEYVDSRLRHLGYSKAHQRFGFANALVENIVTGCTIVMNGEARRLICERIPSRIVMHDWWCYLLVSALGNLIYDESPAIKYRQHSHNAVGSPTSFWQALRRLAARYFDPDKSGTRASDQAEEFYKCYRDRLGAAELRILEDFLKTKRAIWSRIKYAGRMEVWKQSKWETIGLRVRIIFGHF